MSLLGLTGFETSANYIEEAGPFETEKRLKKRKRSVFEVTIDNMWWLVILINPAIAIVTLGTVELPTIVSSAAMILSVVGQRAGGGWLRFWVAIDAILVLSGGVLTAYVGVLGLIKQLALDRCLPNFFLQTNTITGTNHWIVVVFFVLCVVLYTMTNGDVLILSGVFAIAFLMVLLAFAYANMQLKICRPRLPRGVRIGWLGVLFGFAAMFIGLVGNVIFNPVLLLFFILYLFFFLGVITVTFQWIRITKTCLYIIQQIPALERRIGPYLRDSLRKLRQHSVVFFAKSAELHILNKAILYAR